MKNYRDFFVLFDFFDFLIDFSSFFLKILFGQVGLSNSASKCKKDDFPEPDGPTKATRSPGLILKLTSLKTWICPFLCKKFFLLLLLLLKIYSYLSALVTFIFDITFAGKKDATAVISIEKMNIIKIETGLISLGNSSKK